MSSAALSLIVDLRGRDYVSRTLSGVSEQTNNLRRTLGEAGKGLRQLERTSQSLAQFRALKEVGRENARALAGARTETNKMGRALGEARRHASKTAAEFADAQRKFDALDVNEIGHEAFQQAKADLKELERNMHRADQSVRTAERDFDKQRQTLSRLSSVNQANAREQDELRRRLERAGVSTRDLASETRRLNSELADSTAEIRRQADALREAERHARRMAEAGQALESARARGSQLRSRGSGLAMAGTGGLVAMGAAVMPGVAFDKQMSAVGAVSRISKDSDDFKALRAEALRLNDLSSFNAVQIGEGMQALAMAGFNAQQNLAAIPGVLDLATAAGEELGVTADISSNILSGFNLEADQMGRVGDVLTATFTRSNTTLQDLGKTMEYVGPVAATLGTSIEEASAMAGLLGNIGIKGSAAGTALRSIHMRMASLPPKGAEAMKRLGIETEGASGNLRPLIDILGDVAMATENMGSAERMAIFKEVAGEEAGAAMAALVEKSGAGAVTKFTGVLENAQGELAKVKAAMADNAAGDLDSLQSSVQGFAIALSDTNTGALRDLIQSTTDVVRSMTEWVRANPELAATLVKAGAAVAALAVVGGLLMVVVGSLLGPFAMLRFAMTAITGPAGEGAGAVSRLAKVGKFLGKAFRGLFKLGPLVVKSFRLVGIAFRLLSAAMMSNPIGLIIGGIALAAGLIIAYWEPIAGWFAKIWESMRGPVLSVWNFFKTIFSWSPVGMLINHWGGIKEYFSGVLNSLPEIATAAWEKIKGILQFTPVGFIATYWDEIGDYFTGLFDAIGIDISGFFDAVKEKFAWLTDSIAWVKNKLSFGGDEEEDDEATQTPTVSTPQPAPAPVVAVPSLAAGSKKTAPGQAAPSGPVNVTQSVTINIPEVAGATAQDIARMVRAELAKLQRDAQRSSPAYSDGVV